MIVGEEKGEPRGDDCYLSDAIVGDGTLFAGQDGVEAAWAVVQPVLGLVW